MAIEHHGEAKAKRRETLVRRAFLIFMAVYVAVAAGIVAAYSLGGSGAAIEALPRTQQAKITGPQSAIEAVPAAIPISWRNDG